LRFLRVEIYSRDRGLYTSRIQEYLNSYPGDAQRKKLELYQRRLLEMYESIRRPDWKWFENVAAYAREVAASPAGDR